MLNDASKNSRLNILPDASPRIFVNSFLVRQPRPREACYELVKVSRVAEEKVLQLSVIPIEGSWQPIATVGHTVWSLKFNSLYYAFSTVHFLQSNDIEKYLKDLLFI